MSTPKLPPLPKAYDVHNPSNSEPIGLFTTKQVVEYALQAIAANTPAVTSTQDAANLLSRFERQWHRMGELWERCQGKGWPDKEGAEFNALRDEKAPSTRAALLAMLSAAPQPPAQADRCPNCDDTGDVHSFDGEWRGVCHCPAGRAIKAQEKPSTDSIVQAAVIRALDEANVRNDVLRGMCIDVALEKARDMLEGLK